MKSKYLGAEKKIEELESNSSEQVSRVSKLERRVDRRDNEIETLKSYLQSTNKQLEIAIILNKEKEQEVKD